MRMPALLLVLLAAGAVTYIVVSQTQTHQTAMDAEAERKKENLARLPEERPGPPHTEDRESSGSASGRTDAGGEAGNAVLDRLTRELRGDDNEVAFKAAIALGESKDPAAVAPLAEMLRTHGDFYVRIACAASLGHFGREADVEALVHALADADDLVQTAAHEALFNVTKHELTFDTGDPPHARQTAWRTWLRENWSQK